MKKTLAIVFAVIMLVGLTLTGAGCSAGPSPKDMKVGFIYVGPVGDLGFTWAQDQGRQYLEKNLGVTTYFVENVPETADCVTAIENLIKQKGCKVIFATSYGFGSFLPELAKKYPNVVFEHCSGDVLNTTNLGNYFGKIEESRYLTGIAAGKATVTNKIGYVAAVPIPECIRGIDAFTLGVRSVNPNATVSVVWTNNWNDPTLEKQAAESLIAAGCDVMAQHQDSPTCVTTAEAHGIFSTGYNSSMLKQAPKGYLTSPTWNWGPFFVDTVKAVMNGTYKPSKYWGDIKDGTVGIDTNFGPSVTDDTKKLIQTAEDNMKAGKLNVFGGDIKMQDGSTMSNLTDDQVWTLMQFVDGVIGSTK